MGEPETFYGVRMEDGYWVGIWGDRAIAENVCSKQPRKHNNRVVELVEIKSNVVPLREPGKVL